MVDDLSGLAKAGFNSGGAGSINTVGIKLVDFEDRGAGRGLLSELCFENEGEWRRFLLSGWPS